jgi:glyoxylase-like metal-dependent hydrolase (beta-lactamase superfamily II)
VTPSRRQFLGAGLGLASAGVIGALAMPVPGAAAQPGDGGAGTGKAPRGGKAARIEATSLGNGFTLLGGAGCNVVALKGPEGALLIDGGYAANSAALLQAALKATGTKRVATLINTHWHPAQTGSNEAVGKAGGAIIAHEVTRLYLGRAVESVDYEGKYGPLAPAGRPTQSTRTGGTLEFAGQSVEYGYLPAAHTNGDLYVHFPAAKLLVTGGPVTSEGWPLLDWRNGAWLGGLVRAHEKLAALAGPDTRIIPANGRPVTSAELTRQRDLFSAFHEQMVVFQNKGYDSGDCIAQRPLQAHEAQYGDAAEFIRGAFHSLNLAYSPD